MKAKKIIGYMLQLPMIGLVLASFIASAYAAYTKSYDIGYGTPIVMGAIIICWIVGRYLIKEKEKQ